MYKVIAFTGRNSANVTPFIANNIYELFGILKSDGQIGKSIRILSKSDKVLLYGFISKDGIKFSFYDVWLKMNETELNQGVKTKAERKVLNGQLVMITPQVWKGTDLKDCLRKLFNIFSPIYKSGKVSQKFNGTWVGFPVTFKSKEDFEAWESRIAILDIEATFTEEVG